MHSIRTAVFLPGEGCKAELTFIDFYVLQAGTQSIHLFGGTVGRTDGWTDGRDGIDDNWRAKPRRWRFWKISSVRYGVVDRKGGKEKGREGGRAGRLVGATTGDGDDR